MKLADFDALDEAGTADSILETIRGFNENRSAYPRDRTAHAVFSEMAARQPDAIATAQGEERWTYREIDEASNRLARVLLERGLAPEGFVAVLFERSFELLVAILGTLKAGGAYLPIDHDAPFDRMRWMLEDTRARFLLTEKKFVRRANRLQWECADLLHVAALDSDDFLREEEERGEKMKQEVWDYVGREMFDDISGGGWKSSYTGEWLSREVMDEYGENIRAKLAPRLGPNARVLEIGCASGISMFRLAPLVAEYHGTDLSPEILKRSEEERLRRGLENVRLTPLAAHEIDRLEVAAPPSSDIRVGGGTASTPGAEPFDVVIINSVLQCFGGHNYLRDVIRKAVDRLAPRGLLFLGNVFDQEMKDEFLESLRAFRREHGNRYRTKTDYSDELFISRAFLSDLRHEIPAIRGIEISGLIAEHESELSRYTFDALIEVDKGTDDGSCVGAGFPRPPKRHRHQFDRRALAAASDEPLPERSGPDGLAYVMYTSGTSGRPKGALVPHRAILRLVIETNFIRITADDRMLQTGALAFDASTFEIWGALLNGGRLVRPPEMALLEPAAMKSLIRQHGITVMWLTSSLFNQFIDANGAGEADGDLFSGLRALLAGGEKLSVAHVNAFRRAHPDVAFINGYGPTENTTFTCCHRVDREYADDIPLGPPIANTSVWILDSKGALCPPGIAGEICAGGDGVARGYLNDPELTARKFEVDRFSESDDVAGTPRLYRTGDLGRWTSDGLVEYLGRIDDQVKIRGYRIEPGEIESRMREYDGVREAVVVAREMGADGKALVAYVTGTLDDVKPLRDQLKAQVPDYMVPAYIVKVEKFPLTPNGKVDRRALPAPERTGDARNAAAVRPETPIEEDLLRIWEDVLGQKGLGVTDDFFDAGGHSLKVTRVVAKVRERFGVSIPIGVVFSKPTVRQLARKILEAATFGIEIADEPMVTLADDEGAPLCFALPPGTGDVLSYIALSRLVRPIRFRAFNLIESESRIAEYAAMIIAEARNEEFVLLGYSSGGNLAFHVAADLEKRGRRVARVVMIDSSRRAAPYPYLPDEVARAAENFLNDPTIRPYAATPLLEEKIRGRIRDSYRWLASTTDLATVHAPIDLILRPGAPSEQKDETGRTLSSFDGWRTATSGGFTTHSGAGEHTTMLNEPALSQNAAVLRTILEHAK
jgi:amino acid adenylation domain-containing protein